jgi:hypothetical protein
VEKGARGAERGGGGSKERDRAEGGRARRAASVCMRVYERKAGRHLLPRPCCWKSFSTISPTPTHGTPTRHSQTGRQAIRHSHKRRAHLAVARPAAARGGEGGVAGAREAQAGPDAACAKGGPARVNPAAGRHRSNTGQTPKKTPNKTPVNPDECRSKAGQKPVKWRSMEVRHGSHTGSAGVQTGGPTRWSITGQTLARHWPITDPLRAIYRPYTGQILCRHSLATHWPHTGQTLIGVQQGPPTRAARAPCPLRAEPRRARPARPARGRAHAMEAGPSSARGLSLPSAARGHSALTANRRFPWLAAGGKGGWRSVLVWRADPSRAGRGSDRSLPPGGGGWRSVLVRRLRTTMAGRARPSRPGPARRTTMAGRAGAGPTACARRWPVEPGRAGPDAARAPGATGRARLLLGGWR